MENFKIDVDADGIALITFDVPGRSMNTLTSGVMAEIPQWIERVKTDDAIKGAVLTSGKASGFCAGADLGDMAGGMLAGGSLQEAYDAGWKLNGALRALETCGKPVAAAINGLALGGGHRRHPAADAPDRRSGGDDGDERRLVLASERCQGRRRGP